MPKQSFDIRPVSGVHDWPCKQQRTPSINWSAYEPRRFELAVVHQLVLHLRSKLNFAWDLHHLPYIKEWKRHISHEIAEFIQAANHTSPLCNDFDPLYSSTDNGTKQSNSSQKHCTIARQNFKHMTKDLPPHLTMTDIQRHWLAPGQCEKLLNPHLYWIWLWPHAEEKNVNHFEREDHTDLQACSPHCCSLVFAYTTYTTNRHLNWKCVPCTLPWKWVIEGIIRLIFSSFTTLQHACKPRRLASHTSHLDLTE